MGQPGEHPCSPLSSRIDTEVIYPRTAICRKGNPSGSFAMTRERANLLLIFIAELLGPCMYSLSLLFSSQCPQRLYEITVVECDSWIKLNCLFIPCGDESAIFQVAQMLLKSISKPLVPMSVGEKDESTPLSLQWRSRWRQRRFQHHTSI